MAPPRRTLVTMLAIVSAAAAPVWGDAGVTFAVFGHVYPGVDRPQLLDAAVQQINERHVDVAFLLGDLVRTGADNEWRALIDALGRLEAPWYAVPGNHDLATAAARAGWDQHIGPRSRRVEVSGFRFLLLDTNRADGTPGLDPPQLELLREGLSSPAPAGATFVLMHHVLWLPDSRLTNGRYPPTGWPEVAALLRQKVAGVFACDTGSWFWSDVDGLRCVANGWPLTVAPSGTGLVADDDILRRKPHILFARHDGKDLRIEAVAVRVDPLDDLFRAPLPQGEAGAAARSGPVLGRLQGTLLPVLLAFAVGWMVGVLWRRRAG